MKNALHSTYKPSTLAVRQAWKHAQHGRRGAEARPREGQRRRVRGQRQRVSEAGRGGTRAREGGVDVFWNRGNSCTILRVY